MHYHATVKILKTILTAALLGAVAHAQVGMTAAPVLGHPLMAGAKRGAAGTLTLPDGASVILTEKGGFLTGATVLVRNAAPAALTVKSGTATATGTVGPVTAGTGVKRAADLVGLLSGFGDGMAQPLAAFLNRPDILLRLPDGVTVTAVPFQVRAQTTGRILKLTLALSRVADSAFAPTRLTLGPAKPSARPVVLRIYSDIQCPFCKQFETNTMPGLLKDLPTDVRVEFHHLPLEGLHPLARPAAEASECAAAQGQFWTFKDALFADASWQQGNPNVAFISVADRLGLNGQAFRTCLAERAGKAAVDSGLQEAAALGVNATPTLFVNGYRVANPHDLPALLNLIRYARAADSTPTAP